MRRSTQPPIKLRTPTPRAGNVNTILRSAGRPLWAFEGLYPWMWPGLLSSSCCCALSFGPHGPFQAALARETFNDMRIAAVILVDNAGCAAYPWLWYKPNIGAISFWLRGWLSRLLQYCHFYSDAVFEKLTAVRTVWIHEVIDREKGVQVPVSDPLADCRFFSRRLLYRHVPGHISREPPRS